MRTASRDRVRTVQADVQRNANIKQDSDTEENNDDDNVKAGLLCNKSQPNVF